MRAFLLSTAISFSFLFSPCSFAGELGAPADVAFIAAYDGSTQFYSRLLPCGFDSQKRYNVMIALHGHGSDRLQYATSNRDECRATRDTAAAHGMIMICPDYRAKTSWMGPAAEADMVQIIADLKKQYNVGKIILTGGSMGGTGALTFTALHPDLIDGVCSVNGLADFVGFESSYDFLQPAIEASFGGTYEQVPEQYKRRSAINSPRSFTMPFSIALGGMDTVVPSKSALRLFEMVKNVNSCNRKVLCIYRPEGKHSTSYIDNAAALEYVTRNALGIDPITASAADFYVSPQGDDNAVGSKQQPFATLQRARDEVRAIKAETKEPITVWLRGGTYYLEKPLELGPEDSGTAQCPITYAAFPGEKPVINGGRPITGWKADQQGRWTVEIPEVKQGRWYFRQLHVSGRRRPRARLPKTGLYTAAQKGDPPKRSFKFNEGEIDPNWRNLDDVEIVVLQHWSEARERIESIDEKNRTVRFTSDTFRPAEWQKGWYAENVYEGLSEPGQWYLDRRTGVLTYLPMPGEKIQNFRAIAPVTKTWVKIIGDYKTDRLVRHLTFRGLNFQYSAWDFNGKLGYSYPQASVELFPGQRLWVGWYEWDEGFSTPPSQATVPAGIYARGAHQISFEDNSFAHTGAWAIQLAHGGCQNNRIVGNRFEDIGAGAVRVGGTDATADPREETCKTAITDNRIHDCSQVYLGAAAVYVGQSGFNRVAHNEISGDCEWAISVGWSWGYMPPQNARNNMVEYNHCHDIGDGPLGNHGAIYLIGVQPMTNVNHNLIHDIRGGGSGIVLDNSAFGIVVEHNLVHDVACDCLLLNFNDIGNIVQNNIFAMPGRSAMNRSGDSGRLDQTGIFYRNIFYYNGDKAKLFNAANWSNFDIVMDFNLYYDTTGKPVSFLGMDQKQWQKHKYWAKLRPHMDSVVADPKFICPAKGDYRLQPDSPAFELGFRPLHLETVGVRAAESRE